MPPKKAPSEAPPDALASTAATLDEGPLRTPWYYFQGRTSTPIPAAPIPQISAARQRAAAHDHALDVDALLEQHPRQDGLLQQQTVLYLAYGSNMSSETFRNTRRIVPLAQINVCVPDLSLTFDLPGIPYLEPCFAGTQYRDPQTGQPLYPHGHFAPHTDPSRDDRDGDDKGSLLRSDDSALDDTNVWRGPLVGVVYEVTLADYARIIATEGGGASYIDVAIDCYPFPPDYDPSQPVPARPSTAPFRAHTLLSPANNPKRNAGAGTSHRARHPTYSQPSPRYKSLLVSGAKEHNLPVAYRTYLASLHAYRITSLRQRVGQILLSLLWLVPLLTTMSLGRTLSDEKGKAPWWLAKLQNATFEGLWWSYDLIFRPLFGDGERTAGT
ncbi:predicted protein [Uncinocarpus reesii 1704]|uniref:gamma-glutamylcyclotransferase n=1 Tax=Uncinocarpus reesii (strain UAMH 1704) TaxID=336963 RepID=C4JU95_UNCRE|nr:uncharacterized protein UREG_06034 [Uncinocarpus reesii 1704]EEP81192.1 predicted protein [Uncinocarpus reesii 1704]